MPSVWGGECLGWWTSGVVNVWFYKRGGERLRWWLSEVVNVWGGERLRWWTSEVVNVWGGERLRCWTSEVVNVWGGERLILHWGGWTSGVVNVWVVNVLHISIIVDIVDDVDKNLTIYWQAVDNMLAEKKSYTGNIVLIFGSKWSVSNSVWLDRTQQREVSI